MSETRWHGRSAREYWTDKLSADLDDAAKQLAWAQGYEPGPDGYMAGRDPRAMKPSELTALDHAPMSQGEAIRAKCLDCCAGSPHEVRHCVAVTCPSWPFRMGTSPWKAKRQLSDEQLEALRERGRALAAKQRG